jgi:predicted nucleic acid-binding protein
MISVGSSRRLVLDANILNHYARADRLDVLGELLAGDTCITTELVLDEVRRGVVVCAALAIVDRVEWLQRERLESDEELRLFLRWSTRLGAGRRDLGESSVFACAEYLGAMAITDDRDATRAGRHYGLAVHGSLWLLAGACNDGKLTEQAAGAIIDALRETAARLPCTGPEFPTWARRNGLLR